MAVDRKIKIMGIINLTDDSFYAASRMAGEGGIPDLDAVRVRVTSMLEEGADIFDFGACSTRPGSDPVDSETEWKRLEPVLRLVRDEFPGLVFSIDTFRSEIVCRAYDIAGPFIVNDITAGQTDYEMLPTVGEYGLTYVAMHSAGPSGAAGNYPDGVVKAVTDYFEEFAREAAACGIEDWILDPGFGFSKTVAENWELLDNLSCLKAFGKEILVGVSRKRMIYEPLGLTPETCLEATQKAHRVAIANGAGILRVHDVGAAVSTAAQACKEESQE